MMPKLNFDHYADAGAKWVWPNFSPRELACKGTGRLMVDTDALDKLQDLRKRLGRPMLITSAYRSPEHNKRVGGATRSLHLAAVAFDIRMENQDPHEFEAAARAAGFTGFGYYPRQGFMHIDTGPARSWGKPFALTATALPVEPAATSDRTNVAQSTTVQASAVQIASGAGAGVAALGALDGTAQMVAMVFAGVVIVAGLWIMRERIRRWAEGDR